MLESILDHVPSDDDSDEDVVDEVSVGTERRRVRVVNASGDADHQRLERAARRKTELRTVIRCRETSRDVAAATAAAMGVGMDWSSLRTLS